MKTFLHFAVWALTASILVICPESKANTRKCYARAADTVWGRLPDDLFNKMYPLFMRLSTEYNSTQVFAGFPSLLVLRLNGYSDGEVRDIAEQGLDLFLARARDELLKFHRGTPTDLDPAIKFFLRPPALPDLADILGHPTDRLYRRWIKGEFETRSVSLSLQMWPGFSPHSLLWTDREDDKFPLSSDAIYRALDVAERFKFGDQRRELLAMLITSRDMSVVARAAKYIIKDEQLLINVARYVIQELLSRPYEIATDDVQAALWALGVVNDKNFKPYAKALLSDLAETLQSPTFRSSAKLKSRDFLRTEAGYISEVTFEGRMLSWSLLALYYSGDRVGSGPGLFGEPSLRFSVNDLQTIERMRRALQVSDDVAVAEVEQLDIVAEAFRITQNPEGARLYAAGLQATLAPKNEDGHGEANEEPFETYLLVARFFYSAGDFEEGRKALHALLNDMTLEEPLVRRYKLAMAVMARAGDDRGLIRMARNLGQQLGELKDGYHLLEAAQAIASDPDRMSRRYLKTFLPTFYAPRGSEAFVLEDTRIMDTLDQYGTMIHSIQSEQTHMRQAGELMTEYRRTRRASLLTEAAKHYIAARSSEGVESIADVYAGQTDPKYRVAALRFYATAAELRGH